MILNLWRDLHRNQLIRFRVCDVWDSTRRIRLDLDLAGVGFCGCATALGIDLVHRQRHDADAWSRRIRLPQRLRAVIRARPQPHKAGDREQCERNQDRGQNDRCTAPQTRISDRRIMAMPVHLKRGMVLSTMRATFSLMRAAVTPASTTLVTCSTHPWQRCESS